MLNTKRLLFKDESSEPVETDSQSVPLHSQANSPSNDPATDSLHCHRLIHLPCLFANTPIRNHQDALVGSSVLGESDHGLQQRNTDGAWNFADHLRRVDYTDTLSSWPLQDYIQIRRKRRRRIRKSTSSHLLFWRGYCSYLVWNLWTALLNVICYHGSYCRPTYGGRLHRHLVG